MDWHVINNSYYFSGKRYIAIRDVAFRSAISVNSTRSKVLRTVDMGPYTASPICFTMEHPPHTEKHERDRPRSIKRVYHRLGPGGGYPSVPGNVGYFIYLSAWTSVKKLQNIEHAIIYPTSVKYGYVDV